MEATATSRVPSCVCARERRAAGAAALALALLTGAAPLRAELAATTGAGEVSDLHGLVEERVTLRRGLAARLLDVPRDGEVRLTGWPVAPGRRAAVTLRRVEIYAPDARILVVGPQGPVEAPRSELRVLRGRAEDADGSEVLVLVDPAERSLRATIRHADTFWDLEPAGDLAGSHVLASPEKVAESLGTAPEWGCGTPDRAVDPFPPLRGIATPLEVLSGTDGAIRSLDAKALPFAGMRSATIAVDTDNELMLQKFNNSTTAATTYLASLFATMNLIYERDLNVRLLQGTTYLRPSTTADPYLQNPGGGASGAHLTEFSNHWAATYRNVPRALAMMLSGKSSSPTSSSGIAWIGGLCSGSYGYSFSMVFKYSGSTGASDGRVVPHELGHNFGAPHTHCAYHPGTSTYIDTCYSNGGNGCFVGPQTCPAPQTINGVTNVRGTLMSYCHVTGCGAANVFHPSTVANFSTYVEGRTCLPAIGPPALLTDGFESGSTGRWQ